ncbi:hypothetical protein C8R47DRAFT_995335 [Mycena vitilis]|nr:hypothetical protein C8R47DRAFT_995335 [Mycena vitilis]
MDQAALDYVINHLFLPPKLPQKDDSTDVGLQQELLHHISKCAQSFCEGLRATNVADEVQTCWNRLQKTLENFAYIHATSHVSEESLEDTINGMELNDVLCIHITCQNAGVILRRGQDELFLEFFQASSSDALVTGTQGKLIIQYPSRPRLSLPIHEGCVQSVSALLAALACTVMPDSIPKTSKAGGSQDEFRDVADIRYVSELLGGVARSLTPAGRANQIASSTVYVTKRINDHVLWKSALLPWRRSPKWLIVRVALQTTLEGWKIPERYGYKMFVTHVLAKTLQLAEASSSVSDDTLFVMNSKIAFRMYKLRSLFESDQTTSSFPIPFISHVINSAESRLRRGWEAVQKTEARVSTWAVPTLAEIREASKFTLPHSRMHLETVKTRSKVLNSQTTTFNPAPFEDALLAKARPATPSAGVSNPDLWSQVFDLEQRLSSSLYVSASLPDLRALITYWDLMALSFKSSNPEIFSRIFLAVLELWVALDKVATSKFHLLLDYPPELAVESFEPLLLPDLSQMQRLRSVEIYLDSRNTRVRYPNLSVFMFGTNADTLASRHFAADQNMQYLRRMIQAQALQRKDAKIQELCTKSAMHARLLEEAAELDHLITTSTDRWGIVTSNHSRYCTRCIKEREAAALTITLFEWPLPEEDALNRLVIFELRVPEAFGIWRDTTHWLAQNHSLADPNLKQDSPKVVLQDYPSLTDDFIPHHKQHITIASTAKSFVQSHYSGHKFPCTERDVIQKHPLQYRLWDRVASAWLPSTFPVIEIRDCCTPSLPVPYRSLMWTAVSTTHTTNNALAQQFQCPVELSYHKFDGFAHLRAGNRLQWRNIMLQLISGSVELADPAVYLLVQQAAWQAESTLDDRHLGHYREAHLDLSKEGFGIQVIGVLDKRLTSITGNWKEGWTAALLVVIACRLFSMSPFESVKQRVLRFLARLRRTLCTWMEQVSVRLNEPSDSEVSKVPRAHLVDRVLQLAASCRQTYAVGSDGLSDIFRNRTSISTFIRCAITLHTNAPPNLSALSSPLRYLLERDAIIAVQALDLLVDAASRDSEFDDAVLAIWQGFCRDSGTPWRMVGQQWATCMTPASSDRQVRSVYLNLVDGSFLVDGRAQGTLPREIINHSFFKTLFPNQPTLNIIPSTMRGLDYQSRDNIDGFEVHFKLNGNDLLIRIRDGSNFVSEFIPASKFEGDIPRSLIVGMVHLFHDRGDGQFVDIYEAPSGWQPLAEAPWRLNLSPHSLRIVAQNSSDDTGYLLDPKSYVVGRMSEIFRPLEDSGTNLTVSFSGRLHVKLPRYDLEFYAALNGVHLESKELPGFYVSSTQSISTLIGLRNKLVLRSGNGELPKIFVPDGDIEISGDDDNHSRVYVSQSADAQHIKFFSYDIDEILGRVVGDGSLTSWYRLAYLHIATSSRLRDPLLHCTGTEQAHKMLGSAQSFAFMSLDEEHCSILQAILDLAPVRNYYPTHLKAMESIKWHKSLPVLMQCGRFVPLVDAIVDYAKKQALFYPSDHQVSAAAYRGTMSLWQRADSRISRFVAGNGQLIVWLSCEINSLDVAVAPPRCLGCSESTTKEHAVAQVVTLVQEWPMNMDCTADFRVWDHFDRWNTFSSKPVLGDKLNNPRDWLRSDSPGDVWFQVFHLCRVPLSRDRDQYALMAALGILAYRGDMHLDLIRALLAIATNTFNRYIIGATHHIPGDIFDLGPGHTLDLNEVLKVVIGNCYTTHPDASWMKRQYGEKEKKWKKRRSAAFLSLKKDQSTPLARHILFLTVPSATSMLPASAVGEYRVVNIAALQTAMQSLFTTKLRNRQLFECSNRLQDALNTVRYSQQKRLIAAVSPSSPCLAIASPRFTPITLFSLLEGTESPDVTARCWDSSTQPAPTDHIAGRAEHPPLCQLISRLEGMCVDGPKSQYLEDLRSCVHAFDQKAPESPRTGDVGYRWDSRLADGIHTRLGAQNPAERLLDLAGQWPSTGPQSLLHLLARESWNILPDHWKIVLCRYAEGLAVKQQERRIRVLDKLASQEGRVQEMETPGGRGWDPLIYPDWLLVQLDADIWIRPPQASIAKDMMCPYGLHNALMQLNMGEGKSSVIVPIISSALADGIQLVRVVVLKPLAAQMFQLLKQRVSGLVNRRLFYLPFSRNIELDSAKIRHIFALFKECAQSGGILLCQPEHILSFQLMGLRAFSDSEVSEETRRFREIQNWLDDTARDVLDESDEILSVRYQLIYTIGTSSAPDGRPWRWKITQAVFSLLKSVAKTVPSGLDIGAAAPCQFPVTRILTSKGGEALISSIVRQIVLEDGLQEWVSFRNYSEAEKTMVLRFFQDSSLENDRALRRRSGDSFGHLLLLRGLFALGILNLSLREKRYRVDYGLDPRRTMLAVPYRAKDSPALRAEFGHPDMIIALTCLSYYYGGLTDNQLDSTFKLLLHSDNPEAQYEYWVKEIPNLPASLATLRGLNLDDFEQKAGKIFPLLRYNKVVIDFYLAECVFPKEAREFQHKLTTNAWDLACTRPRLKTGFSGTNDNKYLLPLSIQQCDQDAQRHTNAQVLAYILQEENREVVGTSFENALGLLQRVAEERPPIMVLLDVGAQVLELQNEEVAREWLRLDKRSQVEAAVYFDPSTDEIRVISRDGRMQPFASSLYKKQLDKTLVYLDEAHTRGTDFKFPAGSRAVVTLGPRLTKDKLVQGCMRMRKLGNGHSVLFFASAEIRNKITAATDVRPDEIDSMHVLQWTIQETLLQIRDYGSLWANQGVNFDARHTALADYQSSYLSYTDTVAVLRERESRTLEELYGITASSTHNAPPVTSLQASIRKKCQQLGITPSNSALSEEQERELAHEKEDEREVERIPDAKARDHFDRDLEYFIRTGTFSPVNTFITLEDCLAHTSWVSKLPAGRLFRGRKLCATRDFRDTIFLGPNPSIGAMDNYLRPVQWIISTSKSADILILVSPFEANKWLPAIRRSEFVYLHLYSPRNSRNTFWPLDTLDSFTVPNERSVPINRYLLHELNLFAGQLFCADKRSMKEVCGILGLHLQSVSQRGDLQGMVDSTGFVNERARRALGLEACSFVTTPLPFFRELFGARRKGQGFALTHMGQILRGNDPKDPAFEEETDDHAMDIDEVRAMTVVSGQKSSGHAVRLALALRAAYPLMSPPTRRPTPQPVRKERPTCPNRAPTLPNADSRPTTPPTDTRAKDQRPTARVELATLTLRVSCSILLS